MDIEELARLADLHIPWGYHAGVAAQFAALMVQAELVLSFPLDAAIEPGPVFTP